MEVSYPQWRRALVAIGLLPILDMAWFSLFRRVYAFEYTNVWYAALAWILIGTALSMPRTQTPAEAAASGAIFGIVVWGIFNGSYASITPSWTLSKVALDLCWGILLSTILSLIVLNL